MKFEERIEELEKQVLQWSTMIDVLNDKFEMINVRVNNLIKQMEKIEPIVNELRGF